NSSATGRYDDYLRKEIVPFVESKYRVSRRGIWGKSSGGYGSIVHGMLHPDTWSALADHSGDALFEFCYVMDFPKALAAFRRRGGPAKWLRWYWQEPNRRREEMAPVLNTIGMAAHYSPNPRSKEMGIDFPFDLETGEWRPDVWERWRAWDPVNMVDRYGPPCSPDPTPASAPRRRDATPRSRGRTESRFPFPCSADSANSAPPCRSCSGPGPSPLAAGSAPASTSGAISRGLRAAETPRGLSGNP